MKPSAIFNRLKSAKTSDVHAIIKAGLTDKEINAAYSYARHKGIEAARRIAKRGIEATGTAKRLRNMPTIKQSNDIAEIAENLMIIANIFGKNQHTLKGQKQMLNTQVKRLHEHGYNFINPDNLNDFYRYMERMRADGIDKLFGSDQIAEAFRFRLAGISFEMIQDNFELFQKNILAVDRITPPEGGFESIEQVKKAIKSAQHEGTKKNPSKSKTNKQAWPSAEDIFPSI